MSENDYWSRLVLELRRNGWNDERTGNEIGVSDRQIRNYAAGRDKPKGRTALRLFDLHLRIVGTTDPSTTSCSAA